MFPPGSKAPGEKVRLTNELVLVDVSECRVTSAGETLRVTWMLRFKPTMSGRSGNAYLRVEDLAGLTDGWDDLGDWSVR